MTIKQLWLATITLLTVAAFSRPEALVDIAQYSSEALVWALVEMLEQVLTHAMAR